MLGDHLGWCYESTNGIEERVNDLLESTWPDLSWLLVVQIYDSSCDVDVAVFCSTETCTFRQRIEPAVWVTFDLSDYASTDEGENELNADILREVCPLVEHVKQAKPEDVAQDG